MEEIKEKGLSRQAHYGEDFKYATRTYSRELILDRLLPSQEIEIFESPKPTDCSEPAEGVHSMDVWMYEKDAYKVSVSLPDGSTYEFGVLTKAEVIEVYDEYLWDSTITRVLSSAGDTGYPRIYTAEIQSGELVIDLYLSQAGLSWTTEEDQAHIWHQEPTNSVDGVTVYSIPVAQLK